MPTYEFRCQCGASAELRRRIANMDSPASCDGCGGAMHRVFSPNNNIMIPVRHQSVRKGGLEGNTSWSDFHGDRTEKELANLKELNGRQVEVVRTSELMSQAGVSGSGRVKGEGISEHEMGRAYDRAREKVGPPPPED